MQWFSGLSEWVSKAEGLDAVPLAAQGKSVLQALSGDHSGAARTQENFTRRCVGVSQLRQVVERHSGDEEAAARTREEFAATLRTADAAVGGLIQGTVSAAGHAARRARESEVAAGLARGAGELVVLGAAAADRAAQQLSESDMARRFADLVERSAPSWLGEAAGVEVGAGAGLEAQRSARAAAGGLDACTLLAKVEPSQCGAQCPCCLENYKEGETVRVLPCFHSLHQHCADSWLHANPACPVCRCDIRASLEMHRR